MRDCKGFGPTHQTLDNLSAVNLGDGVFLQTVENGTFDKKAFFLRLSRALSFDKSDNLNCHSLLDFTMKMANRSTSFKSFCEEDSNDFLWQQYYSQYGYKISAFEDVHTNFLLHKNVKHFPLLQGAYYFQKSQLIASSSAQDFTYEEIRFLKKAISFHSVHAVQRYNDSLYKKSENTQLTPEQQALLITEALKNCLNKNLLELYGSYAYMMLADAYFKYANWAIEQNDFATAKKCIQSAKKSCDEAERFLSRSTYSIHNASLGKGLKTSNSFSLENPEEAKLMIKNWFEEHEAPRDTAPPQMGMGGA
ncbi:DUF5630 domain-containing protein [Legionella sp.]|uniref:DUF5630 domain-containing protein n=1 Tax=Legionella sp. TaxID=459 RepID=UPI000CBE91D4|nr:DUF5630 domain-containing protein [Legionella sp.]PJE15525.1 MAG: hypothetical protein CK430_04255 [Legionella sp.]